MGGGVSKVIRALPLFEVIGGGVAKGDGGGGVVGSCWTDIYRASS
jgi:hypothetical protein